MTSCTINACPPLWHLLVLMSYSLKPHSFGYWITLESTDDHMRLHVLNENRKCGSWLPRPHWRLHDVATNSLSINAQQHRAQRKHDTNAASIVLVRLVSCVHHFLQHMGFRLPFFDPLQSLLANVHRMGSSNRNYKLAGYFSWDEVSTRTPLSTWFQSATEPYSIFALLAKHLINTHHLTCVRCARTRYYAEKL